MNGPTPMRVLALNYEYPPVGGGAGRALWHLCRQLPALGVAVDAVVSKGLESSTSSEGGAEVFSVPTHRGSAHETGPVAMVEYLARALPLARRLLAERRYDLVHYFFSVPTGLLSFALGRDLPYVVSLRGGDIPGYNLGEYGGAHRLLAPLNRMILRRAGAVVALSDDLRSSARTIAPGIPMEVIGNGVDTDLFAPRKAVAVPRTGRKLAFVGRLVEWKGIPYAFDALARLHADFTLDIAGTGSEEGELRRMVGAMGLTGRVRFLGPLRHEDLPDFYRSADIFVMPSLAESFSQVTTEAMASGLPVVGANAGAIPELIADGVNGLLVPPRDGAALAEAILRLSRDRGMMDAISVRNRDDACRRYSWRKIAEDYRAVYARVLGARMTTSAATSTSGTASTI